MQATILVPPRRFSPPHPLLTPKSQLDLAGSFRGPAAKTSHSGASVAQSLPPGDKMDPEQGGEGVGELSGFSLLWRGPGSRPALKAHGLVFLGMISELGEGCGGRNKRRFVCNVLAVLRVSDKAAPPAPPPLPPPPPPSEAILSHQGFPGRVCGAPG